MPDGNQWPATPVTSKAVDVCRFFEVSRPLFQAWRDSGMPIGPENTYNLHDILLWRIKSRRMSSQNINELQVEKLQLENAKKALELREKQGELMSRREAMAANMEFFHRLRTRLEAIPAEIATLAPVSQRAEFLADSKLKVRLLLKELESWAEEAKNVPETAVTMPETEEIDDADEDS